MGQLPADRVQPNRPFIISGVDFAGPFWVQSSIRGRPPTKIYLCIFCCFTTKAVHLELVADLTTEAFIAALRRFTGRRGHCHTLYCDNATNFVGASNQMASWKAAIHSPGAQDKISRFTTEKGMEFRFIPPRTPHFGGLWEAAVKSAKTILLKLTGQKTLTYEEITTLVVEIEAILNSRPITPTSSNPDDLSALTPAHFLIGEPLVNAVDPQAGVVNSSLHKRLQQLEEMKREFWQRWSTEYLSSLQPRSKWLAQHANLKPGTMVLIKDDNLPVRAWRLGRIIAAISGPDGHTRVADIKTSGGVIRRAVHQLAPLPVHTDE